MIYKFKSKATGDLLMLEAVGSELLRIVGKTAGATGIIEAHHIPAAMAAIEEAIRADDAVRAASATPADAAEQDNAKAISLRQRAWPMVEMMTRAMAENADIFWGV